MRKLFLAALLLLCGIPVQELMAQSIASANMPEPPCIIYKTRHNYDKNVAVILSADKSKIISYPHPRDVFKNGTLCEPVRMARRYRLDRRGIGPNVAFLSITYEEYSKLQSAPSLEELEAMIIDRNPIKKMYRCDFPDAENRIGELNQLIKKGCKACKVL